VRFDKGEGVKGEEVSRGQWKKGGQEERPGRIERWPEKGGPARYCFLSRKTGTFDLGKIEKDGETGVGLKMGSGLFHGGGP